MPPISRPPSRARHYAHRVRESLTSRVAKSLCSIFLTLLLIVGVVLFIMWLSLRPHRPHFHLDSLGLPALPAANSPVSFNVTARNSNAKIGIYYDAMSGTVYFRDRPIAAGPVMFPFYQPPKNSTAISGTLGGAVGTDVAAQLEADAGSGRVELRLELVSTIRFKVKVWDTHRHRLHVNCEVAVGPDGNLLSQYAGVRCPIYF